MENRKLNKTSVSGELTTSSASWGTLTAEKCVDSVVNVERHSERVLVLKMVLGDCLLNVFTVFAPYSRKPSAVQCHLTVWTVL